MRRSTIADDNCLGNGYVTHVEEQLREASGSAVLLHTRPRSGGKRHVQRFADRVPVHLLEKVVDRSDRRLVRFLRQMTAPSRVSHQAA